MEKENVEEEVESVEEPDMFEEIHEELENDDNLTDSDLFNLIDSMYDDKED